MNSLFDSEIGVYLNYGCFVTYGGDVADDEQKKLPHGVVFELR